MSMADPVQPTYEAVARLSSDEQRRLLQAGSAVERLWAAWALGVLLGASAVPELHIAVTEAPIPGLRAHLAIVLAGLGERHILEALALHDPDALVRTAAGEHLIRTAPSNPGHTHEPVVERLLHDPAAEVRLAVLREVRRRGALQQLPPLPIAELDRLADDPDLAIRKLALDVLTSLLAETALLPLLERRLAVEPDHELRTSLATRVIAAGHARGVLSLVSGERREHDEDLLDALEHHRQHFTWDDLAALANLGQPAIDAHLVMLLAPVDSRAVSWLLACVVRAGQWPLPRDRIELDLYERVISAGRAAEAHLDQLLPRLLPSQLAPHDHERCRLLIGIAERRLAESEQCTLDEFQSPVDERGEPFDPEARAALAELRASDRYQGYTRRIRHLRRVTDDGDR